MERFERTFGGNQDGGRIEEELSERSTFPPSTSSQFEDSDCPADTSHGRSSDIRQDYGYKYEEEGQPQESTADNGETIYEEEEELQESTQVAANNYHAIALHQPTAVISKTNEHIPYIFLLGNTYHPIYDYGFRKTFENSLFWFTYRCDFPEIAPYHITTDAGWGCMLRSAQMLLAHVIRIHFNSKLWRPSPSITKHRADPFTNSLLTWFADFPGATETFYSLHNMVAAGISYEKLPGEWYGPTAAAYVLRDLVKLHAKSQPSLFRVHVSSEGTVYRQVVHTLMTEDSMKRAKERQSLLEDKQDEAQSQTPLHPLDPLAPSRPAIMPESLEWDTSLLLLVPLRLGLGHFNETYVHSLARSFWLPQSVGVLGGRPRGARWFYGAHADGSKVLGLDPHTIHPAPTRKHGHVELSDDYIRSVHTKHPDVFWISKMDPSVVVGFYCRTKKDFVDLENLLQLQRKQSMNQGQPDLFTIEEAPPDYRAAQNVETDNEMLGAIDDLDEESDAEDFVLL